ncbi:MAG: type II toxin-antitoxin system HicB family antitoxin [Vicinamibacterales bacterium]
MPRKGMVEEVVKTYRVAYERDDAGWWVASVRGVRGCHTQGRTVDEARRRIVEALELFVDNARRATIVDEVKLPMDAARAVRAYATLRKKAEREDRRAALAARRAVRVLRSGRLRISARDAARLLGLSHQRVHQLTRDKARPN